MKLHNSIIIKISSILKKESNFLHPLLKRLYFRISYFLFANKDFRFEIKNGFQRDLDFNSMDTEYFIGYYHHTPWSYDDRLLAINSLSNNKLNINVIDLESSKTIFSDSTTLWNFQQGPMLGWFPTSNTIYYNKIIKGVHKTIVYDLDSKASSCHLFPIQALHPSSRSYLSINYSNLYKVNMDYGYRYPCLKMSNCNIGIWKCSFDDTKPELLISINDMKDINPKYKQSIDNEFNHCLFSNRGEFFLFIYRYKLDNTKCSKLVLADYNSSYIKLRVINDCFVSHMCWIDNDNIFYFGDYPNLGKGYFIYNISTEKVVKVMQNNFNDGHPSIRIGKKWIVIDSYPDSDYNSHLYLYNFETKKNIDIGKFKSNINLYGYNRCDLHPRWNNSGDKVIIDSSHDGKRYPLLIDLGEIVND